jgi:hypothetical protein
MFEWIKYTFLLIHLYITISDHLKKKMIQWFAEELPTVILLKRNMTDWWAQKVRSKSITEGVDHLPVHSQLIGQDTKKEQVFSLTDPLSPLEPWLMHPLDRGYLCSLSSQLTAQGYSTQGSMSCELSWCEEVSKKNKNAQSTPCLMHSEWEQLMNCQDAVYAPTNLCQPKQKKKKQMYLYSCILPAGDVERQVSCYTVGECIYFLQVM